MNAPKQSTFQQANDEISLIDLWMVLLKHKTLILSVFIIVMTVVSIFAFLKPSKYSYSTSIEIGSITEQGPRGETQRLVESPITVLAKIKEGYIPKVQQDFQQKFRDKAALDVTAKVPKGSSLIVVETKVSEADGAMARAFEVRVLELLQRDHARIMDLTKIAIKDELADEQRNLAAQQDAAKILQTRFKHNEVLMKLLGKQLVEANKQLADIDTTKKSMQSLPGVESRAMSLLMLENELEQNRQRVAELEERLQVIVPAENDQLLKDLADSKRSQESIRARVEQLNVKLRNIQETRAISEPTRSIEPVGPGKKAISMLGIIVAGVLALFAAFIAELVGRIRLELRRRAA